MITLPKVSIAGLATVLLGASTALAAPAPTHAKCVFERYGALAVAPLTTEENLGLGTHTRLSGAQLYVPAQEGLTAQWLSLNVQRALESEPSVCRLEIPGVHVDVVPSGPGFWVMLSAADAGDATELLDWAEGAIPAEHSR
jgi:hypothetical protein